MRNRRGTVSFYRRRLQVVLEVLDAGGEFKCISPARIEDLNREGDRLIDGSIFQVGLNNHGEVHVVGEIITVVVTDSGCATIALLNVAGAIVVAVHGTELSWNAIGVKNDGSEVDVHTTGRCKGVHIDLGADVDGHDAATPVGSELVGATGTISVYDGSAVGNVASESLKCLNLVEFGHVGVKFAGVGTNSVTAINRGHHKGAIILKVDEGDRVVIEVGDVVDFEATFVRTELSTLLIDIVDPGPVVVAHVLLIEVADVGAEVWHEVGLDVGVGAWVVDLERDRLGLRRENSVVGRLDLGLNREVVSTGLCHSVDGGADDHIVLLVNDETIDVELHELE